MDNEVIRQGKISLVINPAWKELKWLVHGFTTRKGGVSKGNFSSLNLGLHNGEREKVLKNRAILAENLGFKPGDFVCGQQIHGKKIVCVKLKDRGRGAFNQDEAFPGTDGLITSIEGILLLSFYADCVPVLMIDRKKKIIGMAHAGWKGTYHEIAAELVNFFVKNYGCRPYQLEAWIGPSIGLCCYEVDQNVSNKFREKFSFFDRIFQPGTEKKGFLDLKETNKQILLASGLKKEHIKVSHLCTYCNKELFFSYRRDGQCGRMGAIIGIRKNS